MGKARVQRSFNSLANSKKEHPGSFSKLVKELNARLVKKLNAHRILANMAVDLNGNVKTKIFALFEIHLTCIVWLLNDHLPNLLYR